MEVASSGAENIVENYEDKMEFTSSGAENRVENYGD